MTQELKSKCCKAKMKEVCGDDFGDGDPNDLQTCYYQCTKCKQPCDPNYSAFPKSSAGLESEVSNNVNLSNSISLKSKCCNAKIKQISNLLFCPKCNKSLNPDGSRHFTCRFHPFNGFHEIDCPHVELVIDKNGMKHIKGTEKYLKYAEFGNSENSQEKITLTDFLSDKRLHHKDLPCFNDAVAVEALKRICNQEKEEKNCADLEKEFKNELDRFALMIYELSPDNFDACRAHKYRYSRDAFFALIEQMYFKKRKKYKNCNCNLWPQYIQ